MGRLKGKVAVITGAASGIGRGTVDFFIKEGANVVAADIQDDKGARIEEEHGQAVRYIHCDVTQEADIKAALDSLPEGRTSSKQDWARLSSHWRTALDARIAALEHLRNDLTGCIGCGCLSLRTCTLQNPDDALGDTGDGTGARRSE